MNSDDVDVSVGKGQDSLTQWLKVLRQCPLINQEASNGDAFLGERRQQFWIRSAVFLHSDVHALER